MEELEQQLLSLAEIFVFSHSQKHSLPVRAQVQFAPSQTAFFLPGSQWEAPNRLRNLHSSHWKQYESAMNTN